MSDVPTPPDPREIYRAYVADWDRYIAPADRQALEYARLSVEYGKLALQSAFILNGGAIVALAPLIESLHNIDAAILARSAIWFIAGLASTAIATAFAYYNFAVAGEVIFLDAYSRDYDLRARYGYGLPIDQNVEATSVKNKSARRRPLIMITMVLSIVFGVIAYGALVGGALSAIEQISVSTKQLPPNPAAISKAVSPKPRL
jgi:hypothetical protein